MKKIAVLIALAVSASVVFAGTAANSVKLTTPFGDQFRERVVESFDSVVAAVNLKAEATEIVSSISVVAAVNGVSNNVTLTLKDADAATVKAQKLITLWPAATAYGAVDTNGITTIAATTGTIIDTASRVKQDVITDTNGVAVIRIIYDAAGTTNYLNAACGQAVGSAKTISK
jgi:hypothetical protein